MNFSFQILLLYIVLIYGCLGCKKDCGNGSNLEFDLPLKAYGSEDTLNIGDTIRIRLDIPDKIPERTSGYVYDFIDYEFKLITYVVQINLSPVGTDSKSTFDWVTIEGKSEYFNNCFIVKPTYLNNLYQYEVLIIPKQKGLFNFGMNSIANNRINPLAKLDGPCSKRPVVAYMKLVNDTNVNFEFLKQSPDLVQSKIDRKRFDEYAGFCFYVR
jgi:hypothetical protein